MYLSFLEYARCPVARVPQLPELPAPLAGRGRAPAIARARRSCALAEVLGSSLPDDYRDAGPRVDRRGPAHARRPAEPAGPGVRDSGLGAPVGGGRERRRAARDRRLVAARRLVECYHRSRRPDWPWFESRHDLCQRRAAARPVRRRPALARRRRFSTWRKRRSPSSTGRRRPTTSSGRSGTAVGIRTARTRRSTTSNRSRPPRWPTPRSPRSTCGATSKYLATFRRAHDWFHGQNSLRQPLVDARRGACCDGLQPSGVNRNQGAESTLAYLWTEAASLGRPEPAAAVPPQIAAASA